MKISAQIPTTLELTSAEKRLGFTFPAGYVSFVKSGGLGELRLRHRVLSPAETVESVRFLKNSELVPFADNGCGDLYCWVKTQGPTSVVVFADHETGLHETVSESFNVWLESNKF